MAPEVIEGHYQEKCDIWSLGIVLYMLTTGQLPFNGTTKPEVYGKIKKGVFKEPSKCTANCKDLISKMLTVDQTKRPTAGECLKHPWFKEMEDKVLTESTLDHENQLRILKSLKSFKGQSELRRAALNIFVKMC